MAKIGDTTFFGDSRTIYNFGVFSPNSVFKDEVAAVYVFAAENDKGQHQPLYVGETDKLGIEIPRQKASPVMLGKPAIHVCVHLDGDKTSRKSKKADLVAYYKPSGNAE